MCCSQSSSEHHRTAPPVSPECHGMELQCFFRCIDTRPPTSTFGRTSFGEAFGRIRQRPYQLRECDLRSPSPSPAECSIPLPLVQFFLGCEIRNEVCKFVWRERCVGAAGFCDCRHFFPVRFRIRLVSSSIFSGTPPTAWPSSAMLCSTARTFSATLVLARSSASS